ncbi:P-type Atpase 3 [Cryptosporidium ryanae]|uniref:P-type Atpase 3 n=1 Tax=Cryptosporidium ryanae TaxID=515981 RepID=UPI003519FC7E|nr:P-type Atpase 3 [Cryptosporidium ryanae]
MKLHNPSEPIISWSVGKITIYNLLIAGILGYFWSFYRGRTTVGKLYRNANGELFNGTQKGYRHSVVGGLLKLFIIVSTFIPFLFIMIHTYDTAGCDRRELAPYWYTRAITFVCLWLECFAVCFFYRITKTLFKQFFFVPVELRDAEYVCIWQRVSSNLDFANSTINSKDSRLKKVINSVLEPFNRLSAILNNDFSGYNLHTVRVNRGRKSGEKSYFELLCVRYWYSEKLGRFTCMEEYNGDSEDAAGEGVVSNTGLIGNDVYCVNSVMELLQFRPNLHLKEKPALGDQNKALEASSSGDVSQIRGLDSKTVFEQRQSYGRNEIVIEVPSLIYGLVNEIMDPLTIFQLLIVSSYTFQGYVLFAVKWVPMMIISVIANIRTHFMSVRNVRKLAEMKSSGSFRTIRDGRIVTVEPHDLVPGDIIHLDENTTAPCDLLLLSGSAVVNESMLTGESAEVIKMPISECESVKISPEDGPFSAKKHFLYAGTNITAVYENVGKGVLFRGRASCSSSSCFQGAPTASTRSTDSFGNMVPVDLGDQQDFSQEHSYSRSCGTTALVIRTGISTLRGRIIRSILYPSKFSFDMFDQIPLTWLCLTILVVVLVVKQGSSYNWSLFTFFFALGIMNSIYPLYLGVLSTLSQNVASRRLFRRFKIRSLVPTRIMLAGKLRVVCFDKTGTLTNDHLNFIGLSPVEALDEVQRGPAGAKANGRGQVGGSDPETDAVSYSLLEKIVSVEEMKERYQLAFLSIRSCTSLSHSLSNFGLSREEVSDRNACYSKLNGNDTDKALFSATGSYFEKVPRSEKVLIRSIFEDGACNGSSSSAFDTLEILRVFPFDYNRRLMSVLIRCRTSDRYYLFTKGAPESITSLLVSGVSAELNRRVNSLASLGYYLIFSAYKQVDPTLIGSYLALGRSELENELTPIGLLVFENGIREEAPGVLSQLASSDVLTLMVTGDSPLTGFSTATKLGMIRSSGGRTALSEFRHEEGCTTGGVVTWRCMETLEVIPDTEVYAETASPNGPSNIVLTGDCFRILLREHYARAPEGLDVEEGGPANGELAALVNRESRLERILRRVSVYARMSPNDKVEIVNFFMRRGLVTGMVGDGGNDCGALRKAHIGLSFSRGDASLVAPFNSMDSDLNSVLEIVREGRSGLATAMSFLLYLIYYGVSTSLNEILLTHLAYAAIPDIASSFVAFFIHTALLVGYIFSSPCRRLAAARPFGSIVSLRFVLSLFSPIAIYLAGYMNWFMRMDNIEFVSSWAYSSIHILTTALCYTMGFQFRKPFYTNPIIFVSIVANFIVYSVLIFTGPNPFTCMFRVNCDVDNIKKSVIKLFGFTLLNPSSRPFSGPTGSNIMPFSWKVEFCLISLATSFFTFLVFSLITRHKEDCKTSIKKDF